VYAGNQASKGKRHNNYIVPQAATLYVTDKGGRAAYRL